MSFDSIALFLHIPTHLDPAVAWPSITAGNPVSRPVHDGNDMGSDRVDPGGLGSIALIAALWAFNRMRFVSIERALAAHNGVLTDSVRQRLSDPLFLVSVQSRVGVLAGVVFLMVNKPDLAESVAIIVIALFVGLASTTPVWTRDRSGRRLVGGNV